MKVSIALAVYNGARHLTDQLNSYIAQNRLPDELVVSDDCSTDETMKILEAFAAGSPFPVHILRQERNQGVVRNFENAIKECSGDVICLSDADDVWLPEKIERLAQEFEAFPNVGLVFSDADLVDEDLGSLGLTMWDGRFSRDERKKAREGRWVEVVLERNVVGGATSAFRSMYRHYFLPIPPDLRLLHDGWIVLIIASLAEIRFVDQPLMMYRQHEAQANRTLLGHGADPAVRPNRMAMCMHGVERYVEKQKEALRLLDTLTQFKDSQLAENFFLERSKRAVAARISETERAIQHFRTRKSLRRGRAFRLSTVASELLNGNYSQFSNGLRSAARDLIEN